MQLADKIALVTGSTSGIGAATARALADEGAHVIVAGRDELRGQSVVESVRARGGTASFIAATLHDERSARALATSAVEVGGRVDILVNNAGAITFGPTAGTTEAAFDELYAVNVKAPFFLVAALAPAMAERGTGAIVSVSSMGAAIGQAGAAVYGSTKAAISLLTKAWAAEYGPSGVRVNAVAPGPTRTEGTAIMGDTLDQMAGAAPAGRVGSPQEIANAIVFLATDSASFVQGAVLPVDGGRTAI